METAMRNVTINDRHTPTQTVKPEPDDQPLDFSAPRKVTIESEENIRKASNDSAVSLSQDQEYRVHSPVNTQTLTDIPDPKPSTGPDPKLTPPFPSLFPPTTLPMMNGMPFICPPQPAMFPGGFIPPTAFPSMWQNQMAMLMGQEAARKALGQPNSLNRLATNNRNNESSPNPVPMRRDNQTINPGVRLPSVFPGIPTNPLTNTSVVPDPGIFAEALKSQEEMFNLYKQQMSSGLFSRQVLSQKGCDETKRGGRKHSAPATIGSSTYTNNQNGQNGQSSESNGYYENGQSVSTGPSIPTNCEMTPAPHESTMPVPPSDHIDTDHMETDSNRPIDVENKSDEGGTSAENSDTVDELKRSTDDVTKSQNGSSIYLSAPHLAGSSDASSEGRRSLTPAHSFNGEDGMRPRSSTLPTKCTTSASLSNSPTPSMLNSGSTTPNGKGGFRKRARTLPDDQKDEAYWERRRKNNEAAKRSRDSRRMKEDEIAIRAAFLEQENLRLRVELAALRQQTAKLRTELVIYQTPEEMNPDSTGEPSH